MTLLDRYLLKSVLFTCAAAIGLFSFVVMLPNVIRELLTRYLTDQIDSDMFVRLVLLTIPYAVTYALPAGILTGVLLTLGRLSADSEITAMRAAGISVFRVARPIVVLGLLGTVVALYFNLQAMPRARTQYYREFAAAVRANALSFIVPRTFIRDFRGIVIYVSEKQGNILRDIWVWELDDQKRVTRLIRAESGRIDYDEAANTLVPRLFNARTEERFDENPEDFGKSPLAPALQIAPADLLRLNLDEYLGQTVQRSKLEWQTYGQLRARQSELARESPADPAAVAAHRESTLKTSIVLHDKFNLSLAVLAFAMIGVPLGIKVSRRETSANLAVAVGLVIGFYLLTVMLKSLDRRPELRPDLLLWLPNVLFIGLAVWLFRRIEK